MIYAQPGAEGSVVSFKSRYGNYINGEFVAPVKGQYFTNLTPVTGNAVCEIPRSTAEDIDLHSPDLQRIPQAHVERVGIG